MKETSEKQQNDMRIKRAPKDKDNPYIIINKKPIENLNMSWKAKGILTFILSLPNDWVLHMSHLIKQSTEGERATRSGITELVDNNYMQRYAIYNKGRITGWEYEICEWGYRDDEMIKCIKTINQKIEIIYYTSAEIQTIKMDRINKRKEQRNIKKTIYTNRNKDKTFDLNEIELLCENVQVAKEQERNVNVENAVLPITKDTKEVYIPNTNSNNQSFYLSIKGPIDNKKSKVIEGRTEENLNLYFKAMDIDKLHAEKEDIDALKEVITYMYYSVELKVGKSIFPASIILSKISNINIFTLEYALNSFSEATKVNKIKNPLLYMCSTLFNAAGNSKFGVQAQVNFDLNNS
ncbi:MAG TPA: hypothetical protein VIK72_15660 [Clostridiaceae bacterium]